MTAVRVVAGTARGRRLTVPDGARPTADRVREAIGNALWSMDAVAGARVVDLFAGSGALGIEALSRGAASAVFVEPDRAARQVIEANLAVLGADAAAGTVVAGSAEVHLAGCGADHYDLVFADPPYAYADWAALFALLDPVLAPDGIVVVESDRTIDPPDDWVIHRAKRYGSTVVGINVRGAAAPPLPGAQP